MIYRITQGEEVQHVGSLDGYTIGGEGGWTVEAEFADDLARIRAELWDRVKAKRRTLIEAGAVTPAGTVQTDLQSQVNLLSATVVALAALVFDQPFGTVYTMADNSDVQLDGEAMVTTGVAAANYAGAVHARSRELFALIFDEEADAGDLAAIAIEAGWPE